MKEGDFDVVPSVSPTTLLQFGLSLLLVPSIQSRTVMSSFPKYISAAEAQAIDADMMGDEGGFAIEQVRPSLPFPSPSNPSISRDAPSHTPSSDSRWNDPDLDHLRISPTQLTELAGLSLAQSLSKILPLGTLRADGTRENERVLVCSGPGGQGGDGCIAARHLCTSLPLSLDYM